MHVYACLLEIVEGRKCMATDTHEVIFFRIFLPADSSG